MKMEKDISEKYIFYHIHRKQNNEIEQLWKVGNKFKIGNEINEFTKTVLEFEPKFSKIEDTNNVPWNNAYEYFKGNNFLTREICEMLLDNASKCIKEYQIIIREIIYEQIRKGSFSQLPSRQKCIWLCKEKQLEFWKQQISGEYKIFKVRIYNNTFKSNNSVIIAPSESCNKIATMAREYWSYNNKSEKEDDEYLYEGIIEILEEIN